MIHRGVATFTLDDGRCPRWLFERMVRLGREITSVMVDEYGPDEFVRRIADPVWFQSLGTVLAFDWNASGLTTILTAALKEAIRGDEWNLGLCICGGKGKTSRKTPGELQQWGERFGLPEPQTDDLEYHSRMTAKVDSALIHDGFQIYHHSFFFSIRRRLGRVECGNWAVVQQGMNTDAQAARRYHWYSDDVADLVCEPHTGISSALIQPAVLNLVAKESEQTRTLSSEFVRAGYGSVMKDIELLRKHSSSLSKVLSFKRGAEQLTLLTLEDREFHHHPVVDEDFSKSRYLEKILRKVTEEKPESYERLLAMEGVGPKTMRALALVAEVIYGAAPSYEDPARYSFAHGGKDGTPYPVDRATYDAVIETLKDIVRKTRLTPIEKQKAVMRLSQPRLTPDTPFG